MEGFSLTERQADAILAMRLQSLVGLERLKVEQEHKDLLGKIQHYRRILADRRLVLDIIREDLRAIRDRYGDERRTEISGPAEVLARADLTPEEDVAVTVSRAGYIKRVSLDAFRAQGRGGKGVLGTDLREEDLAGHMFVASTHDYLMLFTNLGRVYWLKVYEIPEMARTSRGRALVNLLALSEGERVTEIFPVREFEESHFLLMATASGAVKKTPLEAFGRRGSGGIIAIALAGGDRLVSVRRTTGEDDVVLVSRRGRAVRFHEADVRPMGRTAAGVRGMRLAEGDSVVDMALARPGMTLLTVCENGYGKRTPFEHYPRRRRGGLGVLDIRTTQRNGPVVAAREVAEGDEVLLLSEAGKMLRLAVSSIRTVGRGSKGVRLVRLEQGDRLSALARVRPEAPEQGQVG